MTVSCRLKLRTGRTDVLHIKTVTRRWLKRMAKAPLAAVGISIFEGDGSKVMHVLAWGETE